MAITSLVRLFLIVALAGSLGSAAAQEAAQGQPGKGEQRNVLRLLPADSVTEHTIDTPRGKLAYTATAGTLAFFDQSGERSASVFYTAYVSKSGGGNRPITFAFNGGPGAASAYLHLGLVGPRLLDLGQDGTRTELRDNPDTWLAFTDLVLIDPIGTGWSRTAKPDDGKSFWTVRSDASAMAKAIALYVNKTNRGNAPKYLLGESYGGFRAAKTARALKQEQGIAVSGIVMVSPLLEAWLTFGDDQSALRAALQLPSLAAAELERKKAFSPAMMAAAEQFAMTDYLMTLAGPRPQGTAAKAFYERVAEISGLPVDIVTRARGFVEHDFVKNMRAGGKIVSRYDAAFAADDPYPDRATGHGGDPILDGITRAYGGGFVTYARNELGFKTDITYALLASDVTRGWDWQGNRATAGTEDDLRTLLALTPSFRLLIAHGYADMVTPYAMSRYVLDHLPPIEPAARAQLKVYRGGHMFYIDAASRKAFSTDAAEFYRAATN